MKWMNRLAFLALAVGIILFAIGGWQWYSLQHSERVALAKAKDLVKLPVKQTNVLKGDNRGKKDFNKGDVIGLLEIPSLKKEIPIVEGTDLPQLEKGAGHYIGSALPGEHGQVFIAGHRDTVFRGLGNLKKGGLIIIQMPYGTFKYKMVDSKVVKSDDRSIINLHAQKDTLVLATCYPFLFVGNAPDRYILYAEPTTSID
jgi:sortase A